MEPGGIQKALRKAAEDAEFREAYLKDPAGAAMDAGIELAEEEIRMLQSIPREELNSAVSRAQNSFHKLRGAPPPGKLRINLRPGDAISVVRPPSPGQDESFKLSPKRAIGYVLAVVVAIAVILLCVHYLTG